MLLPHNFLDQFKLFPNIFPKKINILEHSKVLPKLFRTTEIFSKHFKLLRLKHSKVFGKYLVGTFCKIFFHYNVNCFSYKPKITQKLGTL